MRTNGRFCWNNEEKTVDTANLSQEKAKQLPQLVEAANFFNLPAHITASPLNLTAFNIN